MRDAGQPVDEEYTRKIREYTTEPFFNSPLTDEDPLISSLTVAEIRRGIREKPP